MRALLIANPHATATTARTRDVIARALGSELKLDVAETTHRDHAAELAEQARHDDVDVVVTLGGDGTINEALTGLLRPPASSDDHPAPRLAVLPGGSTNVFARALGLPREPIEATGAIIDALRAGRVRPVGLGHLDGVLAGGTPLARWFSFCAGLGLDAEIVREVDRRRADGARSTPGLYLRAGLWHFLAHAQRRHPALHVTPDDREPLAPLHMAIIANTTPWTYVGDRALQPMPDASFDAGLDLFGLTTLGTVGTGVRLARLFLGGHPRGRRVVLEHDAAALTVSAERSVAVQVDGEYLGELAAGELLRVRSVPAAVGVIC